MYALPEKRSFAGRTILTVLSALLIASARGSGATWAHAYKLTLLTEKPIQAELKLSPAVLTRVASVQAQEQRMFRSIRERGPGKHSIAQLEAIHSVIEANRAKQLALLTPAQKQRLLELSFQSDGAAALETPDVSKAVGLSKAQVSVIEKADRDALKRMFAAVQPRGSNASIYITGERSRRETVERVARKTLTPRQWKLWVRMQGRPFGGFNPPF